MLEGEATPALRQLQLHGVNTIQARALIPRLAATALLPRLRELALGDTRVAAAAFGPAFAHLEVLAVPAALAKL